MYLFKYLQIITLLMISVVGCHSQDSRQVSMVPPSHQIFDQLLQRYVKGDRFDYQGLKENQSEFKSYLNLLSNNAPSENWTENEKIAYWINVYNAFTLKLIIDNYPVASIQDLHPKIYLPLLNTVWHKKFFKIGGVETSLDEVEHKILRKQFNEPRIHFAINCASVSCPPLRNEAFVAEKLNEQLEEQAVKFINNTQMNVITPNNPRISKIFSWFKGDFKQNGSLISFLNKYSDTHINEDADVDFLEYDWNLNDIK
ncbi:MAG: DUF547 domain-containing protein [Fulvivirga sp.]|uniref:DUF547 domain-containing protein n=1 Tax=Fulvivirga sp. TaxID=1931237 RepID=UPI0032EFC81C